MIPKLRNGSTRIAQWIGRLIRAKFEGHEGLTGRSSIEGVPIRLQGGALGNACIDRWERPGIAGLRQGAYGVFNVHSRANRCVPMLGRQWEVISQP